MEIPYEWPKFEDGSLVKIGDEVADEEGRILTIIEIRFNKIGSVMFASDKKGVYDYVYPPYKKLDSWEKLEEDASKTVCGYFRTIVKDSCSGCRAEYYEDCVASMTSELVRRAKKLAGVK